LYSIARNTRIETTSIVSAIVAARRTIKVNTAETWTYPDFAG
jgi:hypothetical protein